MSVGYAVSKLYDHPNKTRENLRLGRLSLILFCSIIASMLPDVDSLWGIIRGDFGMYHNNGTHSLVIATGLSLGVGLCLWILKRTDYVYWSVLIWINYSLHVIMDSLTYGGRGTMLLWPISPQRFQAPVSLFWGVRWSDGWLSTEHLLTVVTELAFVIVLFALLRLLNINKLFTLRSRTEKRGEKSSKYSNIN